MIISQRTIGSTIYAVADSGIDLPILPAGSLIVRTDSPNVYVSNGVSLVEITAVTGEPIEAANFASLPSDVDDGALGITTDTNDLYRKDSGDWRLILGAERANASTLPVTNIETDALILVDGKPFAYGGTKWENPIVDLSTWSSRPKNVPDGTWGVYSSGGVVRTYRYSATAEEWVPPVVYAGTVTLHAKIEGNLKPDAETPSWTDTTSNGGAISSDGTRVTWQADTSDNRTSFSSYDHGVSAGKYYWCGHVSAASVGGSVDIGVRLGLANGSRFIAIASSNTLTNGWRFITATTPTYITTIAGAAKTAATERWVEVLVDGTTAWLYVDHELVQFSAMSGFAASAATTFLLGDMLATARGNLLGRSLKFLTY